MKRPVTLLLVATLLASTSAFAAKKEDSVGKVIKREIVRENHGNRGNDRGNSHRGNDHRNNDHRGNNRGTDRGNNRGNDRGNDRGHDRGNDRRDDRRHDNNHRNDNHRNDNRHSWNGNRGTRHNNHPRGWDRHRNDWHNHPNYWDNRRHDRRDYARHRYHFGHYHAPAGYYYRVWHRGDYLPRAWYGHSYIIYDWRPYRLYAPPYGYHWVRVGNDVMLTAIATGLVLDVLYDIWY